MPLKRHIPGVSLHWPGETKAQILASSGDAIVKRWRAAHMGAPNYWRDIGYHYIVHRNAAGVWQVYDGRPDYLTGAHSGTNEGNEYLGINLAYGMDEVIPQAAFEALAKLIAELSSVYDFPINRFTVRGHREFLPNQCPGDQLYNRIDELCALAKKIKAGSKTPPASVQPGPKPVAEEQIFPIKVIYQGRELNGVLINSQTFISAHELGKPSWDPKTRTTTIK